MIMKLKNKLLEDEAFSFLYKNLIEPFPENKGKIWIVGSFLYNTLIGKEKNNSDLDMAVCDIDYFVERAKGIKGLFYSDKTPGPSTSSSPSFVNALHFESTSGSTSYVPNTKIRNSLFYQAKNSSRFVDILLILNVQEYLWRVPLNIQSIAFEPFEGILIGEKGLVALRDKNVRINNKRELVKSCSSKKCSFMKYFSKAPSDFHYSVN